MEHKPNTLAKAGHGRHLAPVVADYARLVAEAGYVVGAMARCPARLRADELSVVQDISSEGFVELGALFNDIPAANMPAPVAQEARRLAGLLSELLAHLETIAELIARWGTTALPKQLADDVLLVGRLSRSAASAIEEVDDAALVEHHTWAVQLGIEALERTQANEPPDSAADEDSAAKIQTAVRSAAVAIGDFTSAVHGYALRA